MKIYWKYKKNKNIEIMKKLVKFVAVVLLLGVVLSSCSSSNDRNYTMGRFDQTIDNSTYFGDHLAIMQSLIRQVNNASLRTAMETRIILLQRDRQSEMKEMKEFVDSLKQNEPSCGGAWMTILVTVFICVIVFVVLLATKVIKIN